MEQNGGSITIQAIPKRKPKVQHQADVVTTNPLRNEQRTTNSVMGATQKTRCPRSEARDKAPTTSRRFPRFGTKQFTQKCCWTTAQQDQQSCFILVRPDPVGNNEGIAWWVSVIVEAHLMSRMTSCRLLFDYGPRVNVREVLSPKDNVGVSNWTPHKDFQCTISSNCLLIDRPPNKKRQTVVNAFYNQLRKEPARFPWYRFAYYANVNPIMQRWKLYADGYPQVLKGVPGFDLETGFSCSLESLFHLSPTASQYEPNLFKSILPTLRNERNLVISLYIRSGRADSAASAERVDKFFDEQHFAREMTNAQRMAQKVLDCALSLEATYLSKGVEDRPQEVEYYRVVWFVATDAPELKQWIIDAYDGNTTNAAVSPHQQQYPSRDIPREVLTTGSHGTHTRAKRDKLKTLDFTEALIDWYLIGESDLVISDGSLSFGETAALRTDRPLYMFRERDSACSRVELINGGRPPTLSPA